jgi:GDPmannose 4,6-dehydratase
LGIEEKLYLGNLDSMRDWGFAGDYVEAMWLMLQQAKPDDYVVATGEKHSVRELVELAFDYVELDWKRHVEIDPKLIRPAEVFTLRGDATKARNVLGASGDCRPFAPCAITIVLSLKKTDDELLHLTLIHLASRWKNVDS